MKKEVFLFLDKYSEVKLLSQKEITSEPSSWTKGLTSEFPSAIIINIVPASGVLHIYQTPSVRMLSSPAPVSLSAIPVTHQKVRIPGVLTSA
ncbi:uncharacterized protein LOC107502318 isoform X4 [Rousettus aegyptiacus]|uniref:uncharacterized protein LOC107502318 isoform X4 n=1 Tax=Rousettus aegyptiacus TaxID=9407 RepID=UPI00168D9543|nr:uncharacterized protein LOC107502318 isoform X4 [Rousettus aegyptiacus]